MERRDLIKSLGFFAVPSAYIDELNKGISQDVEDIFPEYAPERWTQYQVNSYNTGKSDQATPAKEDVTAEWSISLDGTSGASTIIDGKSILVPSNSILYSINRVGGDEIWKTNLESPIVTSPAYSRGHLYVGTSSGSLVKIDSSNGQIKWKISLDSEGLSELAVSEGNIYFAGIGRIGGPDSREIYSISVDEGEENWVFESRQSFDGFQSVFSPGVSNERVFFGGRSYLHAIDKRTGNEIWKVDYEEDQGLHSSPSISSGKLIIEEKEAVKAYNVKSGSEIWSFEPKFAEFFSNVSNTSSSLAVGEKRVFTYDSGNEIIHSINLSDGSKDWSLDLSEHGTSCNTSLVLAEDVLYFGAPVRGYQGGIIAVDITSGKVLWESGKFQKSSPTHTPAIAAGKVFFNSDDGVHTIIDFKQASRSKISELESKIKSLHDRGINTPQSTKLLTEANTQFDNGECEKAYNLAIKGISHLSGIITDYETAKEAIDKLSERLEDARSNEIVVGNVSETLSQANTEFDTGNYEKAYTLASEGIKDLSNITENFRSAQKNINQLEEKLNESGQNITKVRETLSQSKRAFSSGDYSKADELSERALKLLSNKLELANDAKNKIKKLESEIDELNREGYSLPHPKSQLQKAKSAFKQDNYTEAIRLAEKGLEELSTAKETEILINHTAENSLIENVTNPVANFLGRDDMISKAKREYERGNYQKAQSLIRSAQETENISKIGVGSILTSPIVVVGGFRLKRYRRQRMWDDLEDGYETCLNKYDKIDNLVDDETTGLENLVNSANPNEFESIEEARIELNDLEDSLDDFLTLAENVQRLRDEASEQEILSNEKINKLVVNAISVIARGEQDRISNTQVQIQELREGLEVLDKKKMLLKDLSQTSGNTGDIFVKIEQAIKEINPIDNPDKAQSRLQFWETALSIARSMNTLDSTGYTLPTAEVRSQLRQAMSNYDLGKLSDVQTKVNTLSRIKEEAESLEETLESIDFQFSDVNERHYHQQINQAVSTGDIDTILQLKSEINEYIDSVWESNEIYEEFGHFEFENLIAKLWEDMGYRAKVTQQSQDSGIDVIAENQEEKVVIQAKQFKPRSTQSPPNNVGIDTVDRAAGNREKFNADRAIIVTSSDFTRGAKKAAREYGENIEIINGTTLTRMLSESNLPSPH